MKILQPKSEIQKLELCAMGLSKWKWETSEKIESLSPAYHFNLKNIVKCENKHVGLTYFDIF